MELRGHDGSDQARSFDTQTRAPSFPQEPIAADARFVVQDVIGASGLYVTYYSQTGSLWQALLRSADEWHALALQLTLARFAAAPRDASPRLLLQEVATGEGVPLAAGDAAQVPTQHREREAARETHAVRGSGARGSVLLLQEVATGEGVPLAVGDAAQVPNKRLRQARDTRSQREGSERMSEWSCSGS